MSRRMRGQLRALRRTMVTRDKDGRRVVTSFLEVERIPNLFPQHGARTKEKMARLAYRAAL